MSMATAHGGKLSLENEYSKALCRPDNNSDLNVTDISGHQTASAVCNRIIHSDLTTSHPFAPKSNEALCGSPLRLNKDKNRPTKDLFVVGKAISSTAAFKGSSNAPSEGDTQEEDCGYCFTPYPSEYGKPRYGRTDLNAVDSGTELGSGSAPSDSSSNLSTLSNDNVSSNSSCDKCFPNSARPTKSLEGGASSAPQIEECGVNPVKYEIASIQGQRLMAGDLIVTDFDVMPDPAQVDETSSPQSPHDRVTIVRGSVKPRHSHPFRRHKPVLAWSENTVVEEEKPTQAYESSLIRRFKGAFGRRRVERPKAAKQRDLSLVTSLQASNTQHE